MSNRVSHGLKGLFVREASKVASNWRSTETLDSYLKSNDIVGIERIDTRALVRHIRDKGAMRSAISTVENDAEKLRQKILATPEMLNRELASSVSVEEFYEYPAVGEEKFHLVCFDFGVKTNSLRSFADRGCRITVVPTSTSAEAVLELKPDGIFLSNGPGDPASMKSVVDEIRKLTESKTPMFGICLGHQLIGSAFGGDTFKLKFGHRGGNQPIKDLQTGKIEITSHNHGFAVEADSLPDDVEVTHLNINDDTVAGIAHNRFLSSVSSIIRRLRRGRTMLFITSRSLLR